MELLVLSLAASHIVCCASWSWRDMQNFVVVSDEPEGLTCWTCPNKTNNEECNDWAPDRQCANEYSVCKTIHHMDPLLASSISVSKSCAPVRDCTRDDVGCRLINGAVRCVSCCDEDYCNEASPLDGQHALHLSSAFFNNAVSVASSRTSPASILSISLFNVIVLSIR